MGNKRLTVWIDGREALPVRAIPYVSRWELGAVVTAALFAGTLNRMILHKIVPRHLQNDLVHLPTTPAYWDNIGIKMAEQEIKVFEKYERQGLPQNVRNFDSEDCQRHKDLMQKRYCSARQNEGREATAQCLPACDFVWLDEFERARKSENIFTDGSYEPLMLDPLSDAGKVAWVMEGFSDYDEKALPSVQSIVALPPDAVQPASNVEEDENITPNNPDYDEVLANLFDPVPVTALEKMFSANNKWKGWADRAARNGLDKARTGRGKFNPYKAGVWFVHQGNGLWDMARLYRVLAKNLPARSIDEKHLLTDDYE